MKLAIVIESIDPQRGGAETSTLQFVRHLAHRGHQVHVVTTTHVPSSPTMALHPIGTEGTTRSSRTTQFLRLAAGEIRRGDYDIVHSMLPLPDCDIYQPRGGTVAESIERNLALVRSRLGRDLKRFANRFNAKRQTQLRQETHLFTRHPRVIVAAVSRYVVDQLQRHYRLDASRVRMVFNGADVSETTDRQRDAQRRELRLQLKLQPDDLVLLTVAHNFRLKGVAQGIKALAQLADHGDTTTKLLVLGRGYPPRYLNLARRLGVARRVLFTGPSDRVPSFYHAADILLHPTYYDPCSRVVLEALASGLPTITTKHNGAAEVVEDGRHGYVVSSADDVVGLVEAVERLKDPAHRLECAGNAQQLREYLSMSRHVDEMLTVYDEIFRAKGLR